MTFKELYGDKSNEVYNGNLNISKKNLTSLEGIYKEINGNFYCTYNKITSFKHCPDIKGNFWSNNNQITSFKHCPDIKGDFWCNNNKITSFKHCPDIKGDFCCSYNKITSFEQCPDIKGDFYCLGNNITHFTNKVYFKNVKLDKDIKQKYIEYAEINFPQYLI